MTAAPAIRPDGGRTACPDRDCGPYGLCPECHAARTTTKETDQ